MAINSVITNTNIMFAFMGTLLGFVAGIGVALFAEEEMEDAVKYLMLMQHFLFVISAVLFMFSFNLHYGIIFLASMAALAFSIALQLLVKNKIIFSMTLYGIMCVFFFLSIPNLFLIVFEAALLFLFGLPAGSILAYEFIIKKRSKAKGKKAKKK